MEMLKKLLATAVAFGLVSNFATAQTLQPKTGFYLGGGVNTIDTNSDIPEPDNFFVQLGYGLTNTLALELQYSDSYKDGSYKELYSIYVPALNDTLDVQADADISFQTTSLFLAYRTEGAFYWKVKAGFMDAQMTADVLASGVYEGTEYSESGSDSISESGWAAGLGFGYNFGSSSIELEYVTTDDKIEIDSISLGYNYWF
jgi:opacity protein-like surface antigen